MRISAVVLAVACFLGGYAVSGYRVSASPDDVEVRRLPIGMNVGDTVTLTFATGAIASGMNDLECKVVNLSGIWVRCASANESQNTSREQLWYDTTRVAVVRKLGK
jgi:hypothetical protein